MGHKAANFWHRQEKQVHQVHGKAGTASSSSSQSALSATDVVTKEIGLIESVCEDAEMRWIFMVADAVAINQLTAWLSTQEPTCTCVRRAVPLTRHWKHCWHAGEVWIFDQQVARCSKFGECARWCGFARQSVHCENLFCCL